MSLNDEVETIEHHLVQVTTALTLITQDQVGGAQRELENLKENMQYTIARFKGETSSAPQKVWYVLSVNGHQCDCDRSEDWEDTFPTVDALEVFDSQALAHRGLGRMGFAQGSSLAGFCSARKNVAWGSTYIIRKGENEEGSS